MTEGWVTFAGAWPHDDGQYVKYEYHTDSGETGTGSSSQEYPVRKEGDVIQVWYDPDDRNKSWTKNTWLKFPLVCLVFGIMLEWFAYMM